MINTEPMREQINRLINVFGAQAFSSERLKLINEICRDLPASAITEIVSNMIEHSRQSPLPKDFREAKFNWIRENRQPIIDVEAERNRCPDCFDTGYLFCKMPGDNPKTLAFCWCPFGDNKAELEPSVMPQWKQRIFDKAYGFTLFPFPVDHFKPDENEIPELVKDTKSVRAVSWWVGEKINAHRFWEYRVEQEKQKSLSPSPSVTSDSAP